MKQRSAGTTKKSQGRKASGDNVTQLRPRKRETASDNEASFSAKELNKGIKDIRDRLLSLQCPEGYWVFDCEADTTIPSEYILLQRFLGRKMEPKVVERLKQYIKSKQLPDGGWPLYDVDGIADISASVKSYFALKLVGEDPNEEHMLRAKALILSLGGAAKANVFTRIMLAMFGQMPWHTCPAMPVEILLLPKWFFFHLSKVSYWSRVVVVPLLIIYAKQHICRLEPHEIVPELFTTPADKLIHVDHFIPGGGFLKNAFIALDRALKRMDPLFRKFTRERAIKAAEKWTRERMGGAGGIGAVFPSMANAVMALRILGCEDNDPDYVRGLKAIDELLLDNGGTCFRDAESSGPYADSGDSALPEAEPDVRRNTATCNGEAACQPCHSPIWDTCLLLSALLEAGADQQSEPVRKAVDWLMEQQTFIKGDYLDRAPGLEAGGWAFQFENAIYPDVDDTAMVLMALFRAGVLNDPKYKKDISAAVNWVLGMQSSDGGWGAFDVDNNYLYLNKIPFADHGALLDPSTSDLTARCVELLCMAGFDDTLPAVRDGIDFLLKEQEEDGSWFGRWGVNYLYGTWSVLVAYDQCGVVQSSSSVQRAVRWLKKVQNADGGWGETCFSYDDPSLAGKGESTASQTSWALLGLLGAGEVNSLEVRRGVAYLLRTQNARGSWDEPHFTGTGFPRVFYLHYHGYSQYFPLWALGVYRNMSGGKKTCQESMKLDTPADLDLPYLDRNPNAGKRKKGLLRRLGLKR